MKLILSRNQELLTLKIFEAGNLNRRVTFNGVNLVERAALESDYSRVCWACTLFVAAAFSRCMYVYVCARVCTSLGKDCGRLAGASIESGRSDTAIAASVTVTIDRRFSLLLFYPAS